MLLGGCRAGGDLPLHALGGVLLLLLLLLLLLQLDLSDCLLWTGEVARLNADVVARHHSWTGAAVGRAGQGGHLGDLDLLLDVKCGVGGPVVGGGGGADVVGRLGVAVDPALGRQQALAQLSLPQHL